jgi:pyruvate,water dikinase
MTAVTNIRWFRDIGLDDVALVGGKNASLGELYSVLPEQGVHVPNGFALTADAYRNALTEARAWDRLHRLLDAVDKTCIDAMRCRSARHSL